MKQVTKFYCLSLTEATDRANLYYIANAKAKAIKRENERKRIAIYGKTENLIAVFNY